MQQPFSGAKVLVTAAGSGIGAATAEAFAAAGACVMLSDINADNGQAKTDALREAGYPVHFMQADCTDESQIKALIEHTVATLGGLTIAANIVGDVIGDAHGPEFHTQSTAGWSSTLAVSLDSVYICMKYEIDHMLANGGGAIVNIASIAGMRYVPVSGAAYAAAKAGVIQLSKFAALTYADRGVRVNCIAPGVTPTPAYYKGGQEAGDWVINELTKEQAIKRAIDPSEQADAILWLCSDKAAMVTGQVIPIDGGWTAR